MHNAGKTIHRLPEKFKLRFLISSNGVKSEATILYNMVSGYCSVIR